MSERNIDMILEGTLPTDSKEAYLKAWDQGSMLETKNNEDPCKTWGGPQKDEKLS